MKCVLDECQISSSEYHLIEIKNFKPVLDECQISSFRVID